MRPVGIIRWDPRTRGAALLLALVVTAIMSALLSGMLLLSVSHLTLTSRNQDYASAMNVAEAGINYEIQKVLWTPAAYDPPGSPHQQVISSTEGGQSFSVYAAGSREGGEWGSPHSDVWITSTGTVNDVSRTVRVKIKGGTDSWDIFGQYALFSISTDPDSMNITGNFHVVGASGSNGGVTFHGSADLDGNFWYCGQEIPLDPVRVDPNYGQVRNTAQPQEFPTVNQEATKRAADPPYNETAPVTVDYFRTHNDNSQIVDSTGKELISETKPLLNDKALGKTEVITIPPGDYYFEGIDLQNARVSLDTAGGPVNIWIGPEAGTGKDDVINGNSLLFTSQNVTRFHLYEGSGRTLRMNGTMDFYGCILAYNGPDPKTGDYYGDVVLNGTGIITGSVIANTVTKAQGTADVIFQSGGGGGGNGSGGQGPVFGVVSYWEELNPR